MKHRKRKTTPAAPHVCRVTFTLNASLNHLPRVSQKFTVLDGDSITIDYPVTLDLLEGKPQEAPA
jgi:hypothetical protein